MTGAERVIVCHAGRWNQNLGIYMAVQWQKAEKVQISHFSLVRWFWKMALPMLANLSPHQPIIIIVIIITVIHTHHCHHHAWGVGREKPETFLPRRHLKKREVGLHQASSNFCSRHH